MSALEVSVKRDLTVLKTSGCCTILSLESFCCFVFNVLVISAVTSPQRLKNLLCCIKIEITWYCRTRLFSRQLFNFPNPHDHSIYTIKCSAVQFSSVQVQCSAAQCSAVQFKCSAVQCSAVQCKCSAVQCSAVQCKCSAVQCSAVQCSRVQCSAVQCSAVQYSAAQYSTVHCTIQYNTVLSFIAGRNTNAHLSIVIFTPQHKETHYTGVQIPVKII